MSDLIERLEAIDVDDDHELYENALILREAAAALRAAAEREARLVEALQSIAANSCCDTCREAALVARAALAATKGENNDAG